MDIASIDKNLKVESTIGRDDVVWLDAAQSPFVIYGAASCNPYVRMPQPVADQVNPGVAALCKNTAGVRARFRTDSPFVAIHVRWKAACGMGHMPVLGTRGFDLYAVREGQQFFVRPFIPPYSLGEGFESLVDVDGQMRDYVLNFPLYNDVEMLYIGVREGSHFERPAEYANDLPVVFYGSSITQGGCASRPGNSYQNILSRRLNMDYINLGFSGSGKAEPVMAEYLAGLDMMAFVSDYDHNAPDVEHLKQTHYGLYETIREKHPDIPYIMISKPDFHHYSKAVCHNNALRRREIIDSYHRALAAGDRHVYYIDGAMLFEGEEADACTVDGCHPNDLGFYRFAQALLPTLRRALYK